MANTNLYQGVVALATGLLFGAGLAVSGMNDTSKVQGFLDLAGRWDITLAFVMMGALAIGLITFRLILKRDKPLIAEAFHLPTKTKLDKRLVGGALLFGLGWGLVGYCPGPALASLAHGYWQTLVFVFAMFAGAHLSKKLNP